MADEGPTEIPAPIACGSGLGQRKRRRSSNGFLQQFVDERKADSQIARELNQANVPNHFGRPARIRLARRRMVSLRHEILGATGRPAVFGADT
jgi:hypothetical protein